MRASCLLLCGTLFSVTASADPAPPYDRDLLSDLANWEISADQWLLSKGILSKRTPLYHGDKLLIVKEKVVAVPRHYSLTCDLVNIKRQNDALPVAGLVFGFVDSRNYWSVTIRGNRPTPMVELTQVKEGKKTVSASVPVPKQPDHQKMGLRLTVHHAGVVRVSLGKAHLLSYMTSNGIDRGRVGLSFLSGICSFANVRISGIVPR